MRNLRNGWFKFNKLLWYVLLFLLIALILVNWFDHKIVAQCLTLAMSICLLINTFWSDKKRNEDEDD